MKKTATLFVMIALIACTLQAQKLPKGATKEIKNGVEIINNIDTPLYPKRTLELKEEIVYGKEDEMLLPVPSFLGVNDDEHAFIGNFREVSIKVFDKKGKFIKSLGRKGKGPGEFDWLPIIHFIDNNEFIAYDFRSYKFQWFKSYKFIKSKIFRPSISGIFFTNKNEFYLKLNRERKMKTSSSIYAIYKYNTDLLLLDSLTFVIKEENPATILGINTQSTSDLFQSYPHFASSGKNGCIYYTFNDDYVIDIYCANKLIKRITKPYNKAKIPESDKEEYLDITGYKQKGADTSVFNKFYPTIARIAVEDDGTIWVQTNEKKMIKQKEFFVWNIFNENGIYEAKIWLDKNFEKILKNKMYVTETDSESGQSYVKRYSINWKN